MLGLGGLIGADARVPTMVLMRAPLGHRGSYAPTALNIVQCLGWSVFELIVIATGASALSQQVLGFGGTAFWKILFGVVATALALLGPVGFVRRYVRKFAVWVVIASLLYLSWWSLHGQHVDALWHRPGSHAFWPGFDLVLASIISWTPLVADYTRFSTQPRRGILGRGPRLLRADDPAVRARRGDRDVAAHRRRARAPDRDRGRRRGERARAARADGGRERRGVRERLLGRRLAPEPAARRARSACSWRRRRPSRRSGRCSSTCGTTSRSCSCSARSSCRSSACCSPTGCSPGATTCRGTSSRPPALRVWPLVAWLAGFCLYQWLYPDGPAWWTRLVAHTDPHALPWGGASLPSFAAAFVLTSAAGLLARRPALVARVIALLGNLSRDFLPGRAAAHGRRPVPRGARASAARHAGGRLRALRGRRPGRAPARRSPRSVRRCGTCRARRRRASRCPTTGDRRRDDGARARRHLGSRRRPGAARGGALGARRAARAQRLPGRDARRRGARGRRLSLDGQGLVRPSRTGPLVLDADFDPELLRHVSVLKLNDEEAEVIGDPHRARRARAAPHRTARAGRPSSRTGTSTRCRHSRSRAIRPGAGDGFCVAYLAGRSAGLAPAAAAPAGDGGGRGDAGGGIVIALLAATAGGLFAVDLETRRARARGAVRAGPGAEPQPAAGGRGGGGRIDRRRGRRCAAADARLARRRHDLARVGPRASARRRRSRSAASNPDLLVYAARNRLYVSRNGGVFWTALELELPEIAAVAVQGILNSPRATMTARAADPHPLDPVALALGDRVELRGAAELGALADLDLLAERDPAVAREVDRERPGGGACRRRPRGRRRRERTPGSSSGCPRARSS